mmetsp:Transcript_15768/g.53503  ORF Transcript_15768/g.53503 Transcript_15768/m.53503 type:complete len:257 (+) Transcript_15768:16-786(+)
MARAAAAAAAVHLPEEGGLVVDAEAHSYNGLAWATTLSTVLWWVIMDLTRLLLPGVAFDSVHRGIAAVHVAILVPWSLLAVWRVHAGLGSGMLWWALEVSTGFFVYDCVSKPVYESLLLKRHRFDWFMVAHHLATIAAMVFSALRRHIPLAVLALKGVLVSEPSTLFLNIMYILRTAGYDDTRLALANKLVFAGVFFLVRIGYGFYFVFIELAGFHGAGRYLMLGSGLALYGVSLYWLWRIYLMAKRIFFPKGRKA